MKTIQAEPETLTRRGRPRSTHARDSILAAALELLEEKGYAAVSIEGIAARAGVGKQTIYRWWPSRAAVVLEAFTARATVQLPIPDTGAMETDLEQFLCACFHLLNSRTGKIVRGLMAAALQDPSFQEDLRERFIVQRRAALRTILQRGLDRGELPAGSDLEFLMDVIYGVLWYRLLNQHTPLDPDLARQLAGFLLNGAKEKTE